MGQLLQLRGSLPDLRGALRDAALQFLRQFLQISSRALPPRNILEDHQHPFLARDLERSGVDEEGLLGGLAVHAKSHVRLHLLVAPAGLHRVEHRPAHHTAIAIGPTAAPLRVVQGMDALQGLAAAQAFELVRTPVGKLGPRTVNRLHAPLPVHHHHDKGHALEHGAQLCFIIPKPAPGLLGLCNVHQSKQQPLHVAVRALHRHQPPVPIGDAAVRLVGVLEGLGPDGERLAGLDDASEDGLVFFVRIEIEVILGEEELGLPVRSLRVGPVNPEEVEIPIQAGHHHVCAIRHTGQQAVGVFQLRPRVLSLWVSVPGIFCHYAAP